MNVPVLIEIQSPNPKWNKGLCFSDIVSRWTHIQFVRNTYFKICQKIFFVSMNKLLGLGGRQVEKDKHLM